jgi:hypothetical protein
MLCIKWHHIVIVNTPGPLLALFACNSTVQTMSPGKRGNFSSFAVLRVMGPTTSGLNHVWLVCRSSRQSKGQLPASPTHHSFVLVALFTWTYTCIDNVIIKCRLYTSVNLLRRESGRGWQDGDKVMKQMCRSDGRILYFVILPKLLPEVLFTT